MTGLTSSERLKFRLLADGLTISANAQRLLTDLNEGRALTPADYASTSGVILQLEDDVWVNAPIVDYNPNFVHESPYGLEVEDSHLVVRGQGLESTARFWLPPDYHGGSDSSGVPYNYQAFTHGDRVRLAPIGGCAMVCKFCNIPYEDKYRTKPLESLIEALETALTDPSQPAHHVLVSGGTPHDRDIGYLQDAYEQILLFRPGLEVDIMMVPIDGLLDLARLDELGVHEFSINIELFNREAASNLMRQKYGKGLDWYLDYIERGASILGPGRIRSMLLVGIEPIEDTLKGVQAILDRGGVPVLSPFRPAPTTPLADTAPPTAETVEEVYLRSLELASAADSLLGPSCPPCSHNTITLMSGIPDYTYRHPVPNMV